MKLIICLFLLTSVRSEKSVYMLKTETGYVQPIRKGYVYSQRNNEPAKIITIDNAKREEIIKPSNKGMCDFKSDVISELCRRRNSHVKVEKNITDNGIVKSKENSQDVKGTASELNNMYSDGGFQVDAEDLRTDNMYIYEDWPSMHHTPYDYEKTKLKTEYENDKSRSMYGNEKIIPVYEHVDEYRPPITPIVTEKPHISKGPPIPYQGANNVGRVNNGDMLTFKGLSWDSEKGSHNNKPFINTEAQNSHSNNAPSGSYNIAMAHSAPYLQANNDHGYHKNNDYKHYNKANEEKNSEGLHSKYDANKYNGYKDFLDTFANKFGAEDLSKNSKYMLKMNSDKGEKKNGFRRVYHKDEYQEDNEFFDNTNKKSATEHDGASKIHSGGAEAFLKSHAAAALGEENDSINKHKDHHLNNYERNNEGHNYNRGDSHNYNRYNDHPRHPYHDPLGYNIMHYGK